MGTPVTRKTVKLFYDVVSPYSWIGFEVMCRYREKWNINLVLKPLFLGGIMQGAGACNFILVMCRYQNKWNVDLKLKPFFLGGVMNEADNRPPGMVPRKGVYMKDDVTWLARHYQIPIKFPSNPMESIFGPAVSLPAMRFLTAVNMTHPDKVEEVSRQLWYRVWNKDLPINKPGNIVEAAVAAGLAESDIKEMLTKVQTQEVKDKIREVTQEALDHGAFGAPTIVTTDSNNEPCMIFGSDRFHILADILGEKYEGPLLEYNKCKL